jgi:hypothetical protein
VSVLLRFGEHRTEKDLHVAGCVQREADDPHAVEESSFADEKEVADLLAVLLDEPRAGVAGFRLQAGRRNM